MNLRHVASCGLVCAVFALTACDSGRQVPPKVLVRVANAAPGFALLGYSREQPRDREPDELPFKNVVDASYDVDTYDFFVYERSMSASYTPRTWTFTQQLIPERNYTFVLTQVGTDMKPVIFETPGAPTAEAQITALHAAEGLPSLDLYLVRPGVGIAGATPRGSFAAQGQIAPQTLAGGDYELWLTEAGNPANVVLTTQTFALTAGVTSTFVVVPEKGLGTPRASVMVLQPTPGVLYDVNSPSEIRVVNGATDTTPRDVAIDSQFSPPLFSAVPFADPTPYQTLSVATHTVNVTPVANQGVLELTQQVGTLALQRLTLLFGGTAGTLTSAAALDDGRRIQNEAKLLLLNAASQFPAVEFVLASPGADPSQIAPYRVLVAPGAPAGYDSVAPGDYDLYLRQPSTTTQISTTLYSGPTRLTLAAEGIYGVMAINGPDTATAGIALFDDFP